jgi:hypothetical protein
MRSRGSGGGRAARRGSRRRWPWFKQGYGLLERNLLLERLGLGQETVNAELRRKLKRFSQAVIASAAEWEDPRIGEARTLCQKAADIEASFSVSAASSAKEKRLALLKAVLLYDLAGLPGASASYAARNGLDPRLKEFFARKGNTVWGLVARDDRALQLSLREETEQKGEGPAADIGTWLESSFGDLIQEIGYRMQGQKDSEVPRRLFENLATLASDFETGITGDDVSALERLVELRERSNSLKLFRHYHHWTPTIFARSVCRLSFGQLNSRHYVVAF